jgi:hypothetical protein
LGLGYDLVHNSPHSWANVLDVWKGNIVADFIENFQSVDAEEMYRYLETFLGESTKALWEAFKKEKPTEFQTLIGFGSNPYNFVNKIHSLVTGEDPNSGHIGLQKEAIKQLDQLSIYKWKYIKQFLQDYFYLVCISGNAFNQDL